MNRDPHAWSTLGAAIRNDRERQGLTREDLAALIKERGGSVTTRTIGNIERGLVPKRLAKPQSLEVTVAALGWPQGKVDRILAGEDPAGVSDSEPSHPESRPRAFSDPRAQIIWDLDLPLDERERMIRDLMEGELRRAREQEEGEQTRAAG